LRSRNAPTTCPREAVLMRSEEIGIQLDPASLQPVGAVHHRDHEGRTRPDTEPSTGSSSGPEVKLVAPWPGVMRMHYTRQSGIPVAGDHVGPVA
jgi:hypothetical protein